MPKVHYFKKGSSCFTCCCHKCSLKKKVVTPVPDKPRKRIYKERWVKLGENGFLTSIALEVSL